MRQRISISRLLHNEKLMMVVSLVAAIVIWALVVYGPGNVEEITFTDVPIPKVTLSEDIVENYDLYVVSQDKEFATVKVTGTRAEIGRLRGNDIKLALDAGSITKPGTYDVRYRVVSYGDYDVKIVGDGVVKVICDEFYEKDVEVSFDTANVTVSDSRKYRIGAPYIAGDSSETSSAKNAVKVKGPKSDVLKIDRVVAIVSDKAELSELGVFTATLVAYDANKKPIESIQFLNASENMVTVHVPVETYYKVSLKQELGASVYFKDKAPDNSQFPTGYGAKKDLVVFSPAELEFWSVSDKYYNKLMDKIKKELVFDFDQLTPEDLTRKVVILDDENRENIELINEEKFVEITLNLGEVTSNERNVKLTEKNFKVTNLPKGYVCKPEMDLVVTLCGPAEELWNIRDKDIVLVADLAGKAEGLQPVEFKVEIDNDKIWVRYGTEEKPKHSYSVQVNIEKEPEQSKGVQEAKSRS